MVIHRPAMLAGVLLVPLLAACAQQGLADGAQTLEGEVPAVRVTGEPVRCINTSRITHSFVRSDRVIDFRMTGSPDYRNTLPEACRALGFDRRFSYEPIAGQLCERYSITTRPRGGGAETTCALGRFVPVEDAAF